MAAGDLTVNGSAASGVTVVDGRTVLFDIAALEAGDGQYDIGLAGGMVEDFLGTGNDLAELGFTLDATSPVVTASTLSSAPTCGA